MEKTTLIARKNFNGDAAAFIEYNIANNKVRVYGKFYQEDGWRTRSYGGPTTKWLAEMPKELREEAKKAGWAEGKTPEMQKFCDKIWAMAKKAEPWFKY